MKNYSNLIKLSSLFICSFMLLPSHAANSFSYKSDSGDFIGQGTANSYDGTQAQIKIDIQNNNSLKLQLENQQASGMQHCKHLQMKNLIRALLEMQ